MANAIILLIILLFLGATIFICFNSMPIQSDEPVKFIELGSELTARHWSETMNMLPMFDEDHILIIKEGER